MIMGIDAGMANCGVAVINENIPPDIIIKNTIHTKNDVKDFMRAYIIANKICEIADKNYVDKVIIESFQTYRNLRQGAVKTIRVIQQIEYELWKYGIKFVEIKNQVWHKKWNDIIEYGVITPNKYKEYMEKTSDHTRDAIKIAIVGLFINEK